MDQTPFGHTCDMSAFQRSSTGIFCAVPLVFQASETEIYRSPFLHITFNIIKHTAVPSANFKSNVYYKINHDLSYSSCENSTSLEEGTWRRPDTPAVRQQLTANAFSQTEHLLLPLKAMNGKYCRRCNAGSTCAAQVTTTHRGKDGTSGGCSQSGTGPSAKQLQRFPLLTRAVPELREGRTCTAVSPADKGQGRHEALPEPEQEAPGAQGRARSGPDRRAEAARGHGAASQTERPRPSRGARAGQRPQDSRDPRRRDLEVSGGPGRGHSPGRSLQQQRRTEPGIQNGGGAAAAPIPQAEGSACRLAPRHPTGSPGRGRERGRAGFGGSGAGMARGRSSTAGSGAESAARTTFLGGSTREVGLARKGASAPWQSLMTSRKGRSRQRALPTAGPGGTGRPCQRFRERGVPGPEDPSRSQPPESRTV